MFESPLLEGTYITQKGWPKDHPFCREEVTRTPDPYVPNVVRYQLRYFSSICLWKMREKYLDLSKAGAKVLLFFDIRKLFCNYFALFRLKVRFPGLMGSFFAIISLTFSSVIVSGETDLGIW